MDLLLLGSYIRLSCTLIKVKFIAGKNNVHPSTPFTPYPLNGWTNWQWHIIDVATLYWRQFFPCHDIQLYFISINIIHVWLTHILPIYTRVCAIKLINITFGKVGKRVFESSFVRINIALINIFSQKCFAKNSFSFSKWSLPFNTYLT